MTFRHLRNVRGFFSDYYLGSVFGRDTGRGRRRRLSDRETDLAYARFRRIRERAEGRCADAADCRERFLRPLLRDVFGFHLGAGEAGIHALHTSADAEAARERPLLLVHCGGWEDDVDAGRGAARPRSRLEHALASVGVRYGLLATGECLRLVRAAGEGPRGAYLEIDLAGEAEEDDPESFAAAYRLLNVHTFVAGEGELSLIESIERESREHGQKVSEDLKGAVFTAAESLVQGLLDDAIARGAIEGPFRISDTEVRLHRDAALVGLYRILFILYAEARDDRLVDHELYRATYSADGLVEELLRDPSQEWPENRSALWARLRALFRIYDEGLPAIAPWQNIPPRGGDFFSAKTPEGQLLEAARLPDRAVARLILDLATTAPRTGVGRERVSFRELDIESLGAVYEGLLEFEPRVARERLIEVRVQGRLYVLSPKDLARLCEAKSLSLQGEQDLVAGTAAGAYHVDADDEEDLEGDDEEAADAGEGDDGDDGGEGLKKGGAARVLRALESGRFHFVPGSGRKGSGTFYTPRPLTYDLVRHALGPVVDGRTATEIEALRVLDPACGSAHFLIEAMRFLGRALHRAYVEAGNGAPPPTFRTAGGRGWDTDWQVTDEEARASNSEARAWCKRRIAERCLFGVDMNPTAAALARVALWIESLAGDRPLTYFEHHVRCGNSLFSTWLDRLHRPPLPSMPGGGAESSLGLFEDSVRKAVAEAARTRRLIDEADPALLRREGIEPESTEEQAFKERQRRRAEHLLAAARLLFDLRSAAPFAPAIWIDWPTLCSHVGDADRLKAFACSREWWDEFQAIRERERFFHWELEFPELFVETVRPGFTAVLGNPPWDKVLPAKHEFYARYDVLIRAFKGNELDRRIRELHREEPGLDEEFEAYRERTRIAAQVLRKSGDFPNSAARSRDAHEDVAKYFVDRAARLASASGAVGFVVPSVVYSGDGCVGIRRFLIEEGRIERFYGFENRRKIFPIDSRYKFAGLVFRKGEPAEAFDAAFMRHDLGELEDPGPKPWVVRVTREEIRRLSPETLVFLEYRSSRDQEIVHRMYAGMPTLGGATSGAWGVRFISWRAHAGVYNATEDRDLWTNPESRRHFTATGVLGSEPAALSAATRLMRARGFLPVFEGKHIDQFLVRAKPIRFWLSIEQAKQKYNRTPPQGPTLVFRETASNTNERTCIAAVLPEESCTTNKLYGVALESVQVDAAATVLNAFCFDFLLRLRAATNVHPTHMRPMPVPPAAMVNRLPRIETQLAWERSIEHVTDDNALWPNLWAGNRAVAEAYGLGPDEFAHILASFPVFARKRAAFHAFLLERLAEWRAEVA